MYDRRARGSEIASFFSVLPQCNDSPGVVFFVLSCYLLSLFSIQPRMVYGATQVIKRVRSCPPWFGAYCSIPPPRLRHWPLRMGFPKLRGKYTHCSFVVPWPVTLKHHSVIPDRSPCKPFRLRNNVSCGIRTVCVDNVKPSNPRRHIIVGSAIDVSPKWIITVRGWITASGSVIWNISYCFWYTLGPVRRIPYYCLDGITFFAIPKSVSSIPSWYI